MLDPGFNSNFCYIWVTMESLELHKTYTIPEYFLQEGLGEVRHEFINGNLIEMSGASREHHKICKNLLRLGSGIISSIFV